jgi:hypothetical protein
MTGLAAPFLYLTRLLGELRALAVSLVFDSCICQTGGEPWIS